MKRKRLFGLMMVLLCGVIVVCVTVAPSLSAANQINTTLAELNALNAVEVNDDPLNALYAEKGKNIATYEDITSGYSYKFEKTLVF